MFVIEKHSLINADKILPITGIASGLMSPNALCTGNVSNVSKLSLTNYRNTFLVFFPAYLLSENRHSP